MNTNFVEWRQTTGKKLQCFFCKKEVKGIEGYLHIRIRGKGRESWYKYSDYLRCICWDCFQNKFKEIKKKRGTLKQREKNYDLMIKKRILKNLK